MEDETIQGAPEALRQLFDNVIRPNAKAITEIIIVGEIAVVAYKPDAKWCQAIGLRPGTEVAVGKMTGPMRKGLIKHSDSVTSRWARGGRSGRVFAILHGGSVLLNFDGRWWSIEPGSLDGEAS